MLDTIKVNQETFQYAEGKNVANAKLSKEWRGELNMNKWFGYLCLLLCNVR